MSPRQARLDVTPIAKEIAQLIIDRQEDERLKWNKDASVRVQIGMIWPDDSAASQMVTARRKRLQKALDKLLCAKGWRNIRVNVYASTQWSGK